ncbi:MULTISPECIES: MerR family transcriptional regulator [Streptomyces]|uniref:MerR family transcriptional regulator n=2 Tax=Streptomyces TaxID=1883 RepID=A0ABS9JR71_9ACTN|nr:MULTISPECIES: MerR family transcriptional regulator [Streptomyces]MYU30255.1 MerR family transcriptional regulator [Streptomyces sp. SID7810]CUW31324.1 HTH-type transcriptional regulator AdhR [Streptomyces reticuli]AKN70009.1 transcriptional regulator [Streptomyces sp. PBH53]MCG0068033.1 MerR family transcriptional regulator [Streptomyces tricolor]OYP15186.1 transcriptional regulator [Streptomyces sp. FBKL.4005]
MRLAELSRRSGVATATIKYYLREGLLPPGRQINTTTAEYDEEHLRRLRLVRAMIQVGRVPVATVREVLRHVDDDSLGLTVRLGAALWALPQVPEPEEDDAFVRAAHREAEELLDLLGWSNAKLLTTISPAYRSLVVAVAAFRRLGYDWETELLASYARLMHETAKLDLDFVETHPSEAEKVETAVLGTVLTEPILRALRRLAQEEESARRYGFE